MPTRLARQIGHGRKEIRMRLTIDELLLKVRSRKYPQRWADIYDAAMDDFERNGLTALNAEYYDRVSRDYDALT